MKVSQKTYELIFIICVVLVMTFCMPFFMLWIPAGFSFVPGFFQLWMKRFVVAFAVALPIVLIAQPLIRKLLDRFIEVKK